MTPKVSIILNSKNRASYLPQVIGSVLNQTYGDFELIIWDDASADESLLVASEFSPYPVKVYENDFCWRLNQKISYQQENTPDPRVRVFSNSLPWGLTKARKIAIAQASGEYIGWLDDDDLMVSDCLEHCVKVLDQDSRFGLVYTEFSYFEDDPRGIPKIPDPADLKTFVPQISSPGIPLKDRLLMDFQAFHFRLMRRELYERVGGLDESFLYAQDYDLVLKLSEVTEFRLIQKALYLYRVHKNKISSNHRKEQLECSIRAIEDALRRRGLSQSHKLGVEWSAKVWLEEKHTVNLIDQ